MKTIFKKSQIIMLPAKNGSYQIYKKFPSDTLLFQSNGLSSYKGFHLYFLSDDKIKEGDWYLYSINKFTIQQYKGEKLPNYGVRKIIATTDKSLKVWCYTCLSGEEVFKSLARPSNEFVEKYCELGGINEVLVEYQKWFDAKDGITPIELRLKVAPDNTITIRPIKKSWSKEDLIGNREGSLDYYLLNNPNITQEERELIMNIMSNWLIENP